MTTEKQKIISDKARQIHSLKYKLQCTDYQAIKYAEGELSAEEYAETKAQRKAWREEISSLENEIRALKTGT